jgi:excinuclease ABC subunit C
MDHYIGICPAPCLLKKENLDAHETNVARLERFLKGERGEVLEDLRREMSEYSKALRFEEAQKTKERLESLELLSERQVARNEVKEDLDALVTMEKNSRSYVAFCRVRQTEIRSFERHGTENPLAENAEVAGVRFLCDSYAASEDGGTSVKTGDVPKILLLAEPLQDTEFEEFLRERGIAVEYPKIGPKADLLRFLKGNLAEYALKDGMEKIAARSANRATMVSILEGIGFAGGDQTIHSSLQVLGPTGLRSRSDRMSEPLPQPKGPLSFECYDISHTDGHFTVASRVVVTNGKPDSAKYRKYKIKTLAEGGIDDFESLREVLYRRTLEGFESNNFPTMFVIDGGK